ncbi:MAG: ATP-binding protein [Sulfurimonas sp.]|nr:ATP-binding protein [Sulfurimonas sp.]
MQTISEAEREKINNKWIHVTVKQAHDYSLFYQTGIVLLLMIVGTLYLNRKLSLEMNRRQTIEEELKESVLQMRTLIDTIPLHVIVSSYDGKVHLVNKRVLDDYEIQEVDLETINAADYYVDPKEREEVLLELKAKGFVDKKLLKFKGANAEVFRMLSVSPIRYAKKEMLLSISYDMTKRLELEKSLSEAKEIAEQANRSKSEFLANMSHEIRTPMNAIIGFTELLNEQIVEPRLKSYVKTIQSASRTLLTLINDILDLSKIEAGKLQIHKNPTDISKLCNEIASIFTLNVKSKGLDFYLEIDENIPKSLLLDEIRLRQILLNLIGNAVKFTQSGYVKLRVHGLNVDEHLSKLDLEILVEDTGIGIESSQSQMIFEEFEQHEGQDNRKYGGTGLGLSISKRLTRMMNGKISLQSEEGKGSTFTVVLFGVDISSLAVAQNADEKLSREKRKIRFKKAKILIADDIEDNRQLIVKNFENSNIEVITAVNGADAIEKFHTENPDLILMDIRMPIMNGYEAAMQIKKISQIPIIALTASVMQDRDESSKRKYFDGFLRKPVLQYELFEELSKFLAFEIIGDELKEQKTKIVMSEKTKPNLSNILQLLSGEIKQAQLKAIETNSMSDIKDFTQEVETLALEFDVALLDEYVSKLHGAIDAFDIQTIEQTLHSYDELLKQLLEY